MTTVEDAALETRENIPLQKGRKTTSLCSCNEDYLSGSKFINIAFGTLTVIITIALLLQIYYGDYQVVPHGSVATDSLECSEIGTSVLKKGGNAIDATIASAFCLSVVVPHLTSLDGEGQLLIYNHKRRITPDAIYFNNTKSDLDSFPPPLVIGLAYIHQEYGSLLWKDLVQPAADLAGRGFLISKMLAEAIKLAKVEDSYGHREPGQLLHLEVLSKTLQDIADIPETDLYTYIKSSNQPFFSQAVQFSFNNYNIYVPNISSVGPLFLRNLKQVEDLNFSLSDSTETEYIYKIVELTQNLYNDFNVSSKYHQGTSTNIAVMDLDDNYVSFTMGLYSLFGSGEITDHGYTLDVKPKDKICSRLPFIITDANAICGRRLVLGANDIALATQLVMSLLTAQKNVTDAIEAPRFHILNNGSIGIEVFHTPSFSEDILNSLKTLTSGPLLNIEPYMSSNIVEKIKDDLNSHSDSRGGGIASRF